MSRTCDSISCETVTATNVIQNTNAVEIQGADVDNTAPTDGQVLVYNSATSKWEPQDIISPVAQKLTGTLSGLLTSLALTNTYPSPFATAPVISVLPTGDSAWYARTKTAQLQISNQTTSGFDIDINDISTGPIPYNAFTGGSSAQFNYNGKMNLNVKPSIANPYYAKSNSTPETSQTYTTQTIYSATTISYMIPYTPVLVSFDVPGSSTFGFLDRIDETVSAGGNRFVASIFNTGTQLFDEYYFYTGGLIFTFLHSNSDPSPSMSAGSTGNTIICAFLARSGSNYINLLLTSTTNGTTWDVSSLGLASISARPFVGSCYHTPSSTSYTGIVYNTIGPSTPRISTGTNDSVSSIGTFVLPSYPGNDSYVVWYDTQIATPGTPKVGIFNVTARSLQIWASSDPTTSSTTYTLGASGDFFSRPVEWPAGSLKAGIFACVYVNGTNFYYAEINKTTFTLENQILLYNNITGTLSTMISKFIGDKIYTVMSFSSTDKYVYISELSYASTSYSINVIAM